jgi:type IV secretion system protein VirB10
MQTWLMAGIGFGVLAIIVLTGRPQPAPRRAEPQAAAPAPPNPDRVKEYQERLRVLDERARQEAANEAQVSSQPRPAYRDPIAQHPGVDQFEAERKRREYESLFASNVVISRRPEGQRLVTERQPSTRGLPAAADDAPAAPPSLDDVASAVIRATARYAQPPGIPSKDAAVNGNVPSPTASAAIPSMGARPRPASTAPIVSTGPIHRILEGTVIETVLTNRLEGSVASPVNCLVTTPIYSFDGRYVLIPAGSRVLGEARPVQSFGESRLAVGFYRLVLPDGRTYRLEQFTGLNDIGDAGLHDQVDQHYRSTFGAAAAVGLITGFAQSLGSFGLNGGSGDRTVIITGNVGEATAQSASQTMNRFLNRLPTITIREGHRVKVYLTSDLELPAFDSRSRAEPSLARNR